MTDDWRTDPFADPDDPDAAARKRRRLERDEKRREREGRRKEAESAAPPPAPVPPVPPRTPEEDFWDEDTEAEQGSAPKPPPPPAPESRARGGAPLRRPARPPAPPAGPRPPRPGSGALAAIRRHPVRALGAVFGIVVVWFLFALFQPFHGDGSGKVVVTIPKGSSVSEVGDLLAERGVISSSTFFQVRVTVEGERSDLYPGRFALAEDMSYGAAIDALIVAPVKTVTTITIPEGYSRDQTAPLAEELGLSGDYLKETIRSPFLNPAEYGGKDAENLEGFLFPDTFEMKPDAPVADLVQLQLEDFNRRIKGVDMSYARKKNLTVYDVVTIASMVEREASVDKERPLVAAVIYNRLSDGMPLGIDATTRFATGNYESPLTESELAIDSPYNTRTNAGLPPGPIASPGLASIEAAARPAKVDHLFYVVKPGTCGEHSFSSDEAQFEADVARYNEAREAAGGESPDSC